MGVQLSNNERNLIAKSWCWNLFFLLTFSFWGKEKVICLLLNRADNQLMDKKATKYLWIFQLRWKGTETMQRTALGSQSYSTSNLCPVVVQTCLNLCALVPPIPHFLNRSGCINYSISVYHWTQVVRVRTCLLSSDSQDWD